MNNLLTKELTAKQEAAIYARFETKPEPKALKLKVCFGEVAALTSVGIVGLSAVVLLAVLLKPLIFVLFN